MYLFFTNTISLASSFRMLNALPIVLFPSYSLPTRIFFVLSLSFSLSLRCRPHHFLSTKWNCSRVSWLNRIKDTDIWTPCLQAGFSEVPRVSWASSKWAKQAPELHEAKLLGSVLLFTFAKKIADHVWTQKTYSILMQTIIDRLSGAERCKYILMYENYIIHICIHTYIYIYIYIYIYTYNWIIYIYTYIMTDEETELI